MQTSLDGYAMIREEEGLALTVKGDTGGKREWGYGHDVQPGEVVPDPITEEVAEEQLDTDVAKWERALNPLISPGCTQKQYDALIDFTHECGIAALAELVSHGWSNIPYQLYHVDASGKPHGWIFAHVDGVLTELPGMVARRQKEIALFNAA